MARWLYPSSGRLLALACVILAAIALPAPGIATATSPTETATLDPPSVEAGPLRYRGAWGGLHVADVTLTLRGDDEAYQGDLDIATRGLLGWAFEWVGVLHSRGELTADAGLRPQSSTRRFTQSDDSGAVIIEYDATGLAQGFEDGQPQDGVAPDLRRGTVDPLAALLALRRHVQNGRQGMVSVPVYDGKRRLDLVASIEPPRLTRVADSERRVVPVRADITPVAGFKPSQARGWARSHLGVLFSADATAVPVRIQVESPVGTAVLTLR